MSPQQSSLVPALKKVRLCQWWTLHSFSRAKGKMCSIKTCESDPGDIRMTSGWCAHQEIMHFAITPCNHIQEDHNHIRPLKQSLKPLKLDTLVIIMCTGSWEGDCVNQQSVSIYKHAGVGNVGARLVCVCVCVDCVCCMCVMKKHGLGMCASSMHVNT